MHPEFSTCSPENAVLGDGLPISPDIPVPSTQGTNLACELELKPGGEVTISLANVEVLDPATGTVHSVAEGDLHQ